MRSAMGFSVRGENTDTLEIDIYDVVGGGWLFGGVTADDVRRQLKANKSAKTIKLRINSEGGNVFDGFAIYNLLKDHPARVEVQIDALAASVASVIAMAADEISIAANAWVMIHNAAGHADGSPEDLRKWADVLEKMTGQAADIYAERTGLTRERVLELMAAETWLTATDAKGLGFVDTVVSNKKKKHDMPGMRAFAMMRLEDYSNVPPEVRKLVESARATRESRPLMWMPSMAPGDRVQVREGMEHAPELKGAVGTVRLVNSPALGVEFDDMPGDIHKWFVEDELQSVVEHADEPKGMQMRARAHASNRSPAPGGPDDQHGPENTGKETRMEDTLKAFLSAQGIDSTASLTARLGIVARLEQLTGKTGEEAVGVLQAWKQSHDELPTVNAKLAKIEQESQESALTAALQKAKDDARHTPARETKLRELLAAKDLSHAGALAMVAEWGVVTAIKNGRDGAQSQGATTTATSTASGAELKHNGKTFDEMTGQERAALKRENPELYQQMRDASR